MPFDTVKTSFLSARTKKMITFFYSFFLNLLKNKSEFVINFNPLLIRSKSKSGEIRMSRECQVTGKRPVTGNNVSHANNKTKRRFLPNIHDHKFWVESENRFVKLRVSAKGMRIIDKLGIDIVVSNIRRRGGKV